MLQIDPAHVQIRLWEYQTDSESESKQVLQLQEKRLRQRGILPFFPSRSLRDATRSLYIHVPAAPPPHTQMTMVAAKDASAQLLERVREALSSDTIRRVFQSMELEVEAVRLDRVFIQDTAEPYTCFNNRLDGDETDVDCGGALCNSRCAASQVCKANTDCEATASCFNGKCSGFSPCGVEG